LCTLAKLTIFFKHLNLTIKTDLLIREAVISEILRIYEITKYFLGSMFVSSVLGNFYEIFLLLVSIDNLLMKSFLN